MAVIRPALFAGLIAVLPTVLFAADGDAVVQEVLARETRTDVPDRGALLQGVLARSPKLESVHWAMGEVSVNGQWRPFDDRIDQTAADATLAEYRALRDQSELTPARHRKLAGWCGKRGLQDQERAHLWALLHENANQPDIWKRLGYRNLDGQWLTPAEEQALDRAWQQRQRDLKRWQPRAETLARRLSDPSPAVQADAREQLRGITDVAALPALETALCTQSPELALEFVAWAKRLDRVETTLALARQAIVAPWDDVRESAIDALTIRRLSDFAPVILTLLSTPIEATAEQSTAPTWIAGQVLYTQQFVRELHDHVEVHRLRGVHAPIARAVLPLRWRRDRLDTPAGWQNLRTLSQVTSAANARAANDLARSVEDRLELGRQQVQQVNQEIAELNARSSRVLSMTSGEVGINTPQEWWAWWNRFSATDRPASNKEVVEVQEIEVIPSIPQVRISISPSCLPAGTPVFTELGPKPIETIRIGDRVLAKDVDTGEVAYRPVLRTTVRSPQPLVKLGLRSETIQATRGHHFWVSGQGWRMARELLPGDRLHGLTGTVAVTDVATGDMAAVYNLVVDRANTYFVGQSLVLSHDVTSPAPTNVKVPGLR